MNSKKIKASRTSERDSIEQPKQGHENHSSDSNTQMPLADMFVSERKEEIERIQVRHCREVDGVEYINPTGVIKITRLSRASIWAIECKGTFPKRVKFDRKRCMYRLEEFKAWILSRHYHANKSIGASCGSGQ